MTERQIIQVLPTDVIHKIAAGEVIDRPATVVKELVENALDAGAASISVELKNGGRDRIRVIDDGFGIPAEELPLAIERHTTSKLRSLVDFNSLFSFGFRGEALASIATVSEFTIRSRPAQQAAGLELVLDHGKITHSQQLGMAAGTDITVDHLFYNLPARRKSLKKAATQRISIIELITQISLTTPQVSFQVKDDLEVVLTLPGNQTLAERVKYVFGNLGGPSHNHSEYWWPISYNSPELTVTGFIGNPNFARRLSLTQVFAVNQRLLHTALISPIIKTAYGNSIEPRQSPSFLLFIDTSPQNIDVNVHPRKESIQWLDETTILNQLQEAVLQHLNFSYSPLPQSQIEVNDSGYDAEKNSELSKKTLPDLHQHLKASAPPWYHALATRQQTILQVHNTYLITESENGVLIVDQHAAHERILYQQFLDLFEQKLTSQENFHLEKPVLIQLSPAKSQLLSEHLDTLRQVGCEIEPFGQDTFRIVSVPQVLHEHHPQRVILAILEDLAAEVPVKGVAQLAHRTLAYLACRSAVKAGDPLTQDQAKVLLDKLLQTPFAYSCPHGRPTIHKFGWAEIEKLFHRR